MTNGKGKEKIDVIKILLAVIVAVIALLVRMPSAFLVVISEEAEEAYTDESGLPYFTDPDSYYHVRLVDTMLRTGKIADAISPDGEPWDLHSFYPEGRNGAYQPGIVYLTIALWEIFNLSEPMDISRVEYYMSGVMAMFAALAAFAAGCRIKGKISGLVAGILTGCAPEFVSRTSFGRFDTDIFVVLMNVLLILFLTEMLRTDETRHQIAFAFVFFLTSIVYANCWATQFSMLFVGLTLFSGLLYVFVNTWFGHTDRGMRERAICFLTRRETAILIGTGVLILTTIGITMGFSVVGDIFGSLSFNMTQEVSEGVLPNMFESIAELGKAALVPETFSDWFKGYVFGPEPTVVTGLGGVLAVVAAIAGLTLLGLCSFEIIKIRQQESLQKRECVLLFIALGLWTITGIYLTRMGVRFIVMLIVPTGLLAGIFVGWIPGFFKSEKGKWRIVGVIVSLIVAVAVVLPDIEGFFLSVRLPSVTDASANSMKWIKENADTPDAVIESWWDDGYFYESESDHPCLWDGGTQDPVRAILISRAMVEKNIENSYRILYMLACSGNKGVDLLMESTDPKTAFEVLWEVIPMNTKDACEVISSKCHMNDHDARNAESLIHPTESKEAYLVITYTMIRQTTMYEYYSDWDFTGTQISPYEDDGPELTEDEQEELEKTRDGYTMWRLFFEVEENPYFDQVYEFNDDIEGVRVWRLNAI